MPRTLPASPESPFPRVLVSHAGFGCADPKRAVFPAGIGRRFVLQDMGVHAKEALGEFEDWGACFEGDLAPGAAAFGEYWNLALANLLQALAHLVPAEVPAERKLGRRER